MFIVNGKFDCTNCSHTVLSAGVADGKVIWVCEECLEVSSVDLIPERLSKYKRKKYNV